MLIGLSTFDLEGLASSLSLKYSATLFVDVVIFSIVGSSSGVKFPWGVADPEGVADVDGVGAMPRISAMAAADFDAILFEAMTRALWLRFESIMKNDTE